MLQNFRLFFPVNITLSYSEQRIRETISHFTTGICPYYVQQTNRAFLALPMTNADQNGLLRYFSSEDGAAAQFVSEKILNALPQIMYFYEGTLYGVVTYTVDSAAPPPDSVIRALKEDLKRQLTGGWGTNEFDIDLQKAILYFHNGIYHLDRKWEVGVKYKKLRDAVLSVRVYAEELTFIDTMEELKHRLAL